jgi:hypothetical protein
MTKEREVTFSHFPTNDKVLVKTNGMEAFGVYELGMVCDYTEGDEDALKSTVGEMATILNTIVNAFMQDGSILPDPDSDVKQAVKINVDKDVTMVFTVTRMNKGGCLVTLIDPETLEQSKTEETIH